MTFICTAGARGRGTESYLCFTHGITQCVYMLYFCTRVQLCVSSGICVFAHYHQSAPAVFCADSLFPNPWVGGRWVGQATQNLPHYFMLIGGRLSQTWIYGGFWVGDPFILLMEGKWEGG